jgi:Protein of unknown function (DUF2628)
MALYCAYVQGSGLEAACDAAFVRQSFNWKAFFFGPAWLAAHRLWLGLAMWLAAYLLLSAAAAMAVSAGAVLLIALAVQILLGLEANRLYEAKLERQGYHVAGIIAAPELDAAEAAFFRQTQVTETEGALPAGESDREAGGA